MYSTSRQRELHSIRSRTTLTRTGHCAVPGCTRPLMLGKFCTHHRKLQGLNGSAYHHPIHKDQSFRHTLKALTRVLDWKTPAMQDMLREMTALLTTLPRAPRQGSTRGLKPRAIAQAILWHICAQRKRIPAKHVLLSALAAECTPKVCGSLQYRQAQVARCVYHRGLRRERRELHGKIIYVRISMQGKWAKQRMFELLEPIYRWELEKIRALFFGEGRKLLHTKAE